MEDSSLLYLSSLVCLIESVVITTSFSMSKGIKLLGIFLLYSIPLYYLLFTRSSGGTGLIWWFYLLCFNSLYILLLLFYLTYCIFKKIKSKI